jgi:hypothetical protein
MADTDLKVFHPMQCNSFRWLERPALLLLPSKARGHDRGREPQIKHNDQVVGEGTKDPVVPGHVMNESLFRCGGFYSSPDWMWRVGGTRKPVKRLELRLMMRA